VASLAKDICNQRSYRSRRRREIFRLQKTILDLEKKIEFHGSQVDYYDQYLKQCLANLHVAKKKRVQFRTPNHTVSCQKYDYYLINNVFHSFGAASRILLTVTIPEIWELHTRKIQILDQIFLQPP
jgi:hypothetical protein